MAEETFGEWLKARRTEEGLTLRQLADDLDVMYPYLSQLENGKARPSEELARSIAQRFDADEESVVFIALEVAQTIRELRQKFPQHAPEYFRRVIEEDQ